MKGVVFAPLAAARSAAGNAFVLAPDGNSAAASGQTYLALPGPQGGRPAGAPRVCKVMADVTAEPGGLYDFDTWLLDDFKVPMTLAADFPQDSTVDYGIDATRCAKLCAQDNDCTAFQHYEVFHAGNNACIRFAAPAAAGRRIVLVWGATATFGDCRHWTVPDTPAPPHAAPVEAISVAAASGIVASAAVTVAVA